MKLFREKDYKKAEDFHFYRCDPEKNVKCGKSCCFLNGGKCTLTSNPNYSRDDEPFGKGDRSSVRITTRIEAYKRRYLREKQCDTQ